jgi:hypothetical protein
MLLAGGRCRRKPSGSLHKYTMDQVIAIAHHHGASISITEGVAFILTSDVTTQASLVQALVDARLLTVLGRRPALNRQWCFRMI